MLAAACTAVAKGLGVDMNDDLVAIACRQRFSAMREKALRDAGERVGAAHHDGRPLTWLLNGIREQT